MALFMPTEEYTNQDKVNRSFLQSIKWKLTFSMMFIALALSIGQEFFFSLYDAESYSRFIDDKMKVVAEVVGNNSTSAIAFKDKNDAREVISSLSSVSSIRTAALYDSQKNILALYKRQDESGPILNRSFTQDISYFDKDSYVVYKSIYLGKEAIGGILIVSDLTELQARRKEHITVGIQVGIIVLALTTILAYIFQGFFTKPIQDLLHITETISSKKDYSVRAVKKTDDEFGTLVDAFNAMLNEIQSRDKELEVHIRMLQRSNKELDQFVYAASHDLKAPLRAVDNLTMLIGKITKDSLPPENREYLDLMHSRVKRMETLIDDLLQYSRVGRIETIIEEVDTYKLVLDVIELLDPPKEITIFVAKSLPKVYAPRAPLEQVFRNLIGNAVKHHDRINGRIDVQATDDADYVEFSVSDDGPGIPEKYHDRIFQMFQTLKTRDEMEGSGMGLALVKKIIETNKGTICVKSSEGKGAVFSFRWPKDLREVKYDKL